MTITNKHEAVRAQLDYLKHITTLSTGSILLLATFMDKLLTQPLWKSAVIVALIGFIVAVVACVVAHTMYIIVNYDAFEEKDIDDWRHTVTMISFVCIWIGFLLGVLSLAIFGIRNLV